MLEYIDTILSRLVPFSSSTINDYVADANAFHNCKPGSI